MRIYFLLLIIFTPSTISAQWVQTSAQVSIGTWCLASSGSTIFAGTTDGVFRSTDNGLTWSILNTGLTNTNVWSLAIAGSNIFAGTAKGVFRSNNNGLTWESTDTKLANMGIESLHSTGILLFAGTSGNGVFRSSNNGTVWTSASSGITDNYIFTVTSNGSTIYSGTGMGVFSSTNNGITWAPLSNGVYPIVRALIISNGNIFAGGAGGIYRSIDNGSSWSEVNNGIPETTIIVNFTEYYSNIFACGWAGVWFSTDSGSTWSNISIGLPFDWEVHSLVISETMIFAGVYHNGIWKRSLGEIVTSVPSVNTNSIPDEFFLGQNFPNPFNPRTNIVFSLARGINVTLTVFDVLGRKVQTLVDGQFTAGTFNFNWDGSEWPSGTFFYHLQAGSFEMTRKMILQK